MIRGADTMNTRRFLLAIFTYGVGFAQTVDVVKVVSRSAERKVQLPGEFIPFQAVAIHAKVTGFVDRVEVDRGSIVKKGQLLATLDAPELRTQRAEAEAKVLNAESQRAEAEAKVAAARSTYERLKAASATPGVSGTGIYRGGVARIAFGGRKDPLDGGRNGCDEPEPAARARHVSVRHLACEAVASLDSGAGDECRHHHGTDIRHPGQEWLCG